MTRNLYKPYDMEDLWFASDIYICLYKYVCLCFWSLTKPYHPKLLLHTTLLSIPSKRWDSLAFVDYSNDQTIIKNKKLGNSSLFSHPLLRNRSTFFTSTLCVGYILCVRVLATTSSGTIVSSCKRKIYLFRELFFL